MVWDALLALWFALLGLGGLVGGMLMALYLPIFQLGQAI